jgi:hypothetical protein
MEGSRPVRDTKRQIYSTIAVVFLLLLTGCASDRYREGVAQHNVFETERLLAEAGFKMKPARSPEELEHLKTLTQSTITPRVHRDTIRYEYADAKYCECLYVGTGEAYQRYLRLVREEKDARREAQTRKWYGTWDRSYGSHGVFSGP